MCKKDIDNIQVGLLFSKHTEKGDSLIGHQCQGYGVDHLFYKTQ
jgi:hypothetical protein